MPTNTLYEDIQRRLAQPRRTRHLSVRPSWAGEVPDWMPDSFWAYLQDVTDAEDWSALAQLQLAMLRDLEPGLRPWLTDEEFPYNNYQNHGPQQRTGWWAQLVDYLTWIRDRDPGVSWEDGTFLESLGRLHNAADTTLALAAPWVWQRYPLVGVGLFTITKLFHELSRFALRHSLRRPHHRPVQLPPFTRLVDDVAEAYETAAMGYAIVECAYNENIWFDWLSGRIQNHDIEEEYGRTWYRPWCLANGWERVLGAFQGSRPFRGTLGSRKSYQQLQTHLAKPTPTQLRLAEPSWLGDAPREHDVDAFRHHLEEIERTDNRRELAHLKVALMRALEPDMRRWLTDPDFPLAPHPDPDQGRIMAWNRMVGALMRIRNGEEDLEWEDRFNDARKLLHRAATQEMYLSGPVWKDYPRIGIGVRALQDLTSPESVSDDISVATPYVARAYQSVAIGNAMLACGWQGNGEAWYMWMTHQASNLEAVLEFNLSDECVAAGWAKALSAYQGSRPFRGTLGARPASITRDRLIGMREELASAANEGLSICIASLDEEVGPGACGEVADLMATELHKAGFTVFIADILTGDEAAHSWVVVRAPDGDFSVDVPHGVYEEPHGSRWLVYRDVTISPQDVVIMPFDLEDYGDLKGYIDLHPFRPPSSPSTTGARRQDYEEIRRYLDEPIQYVYPEQPQELLLQRTPSRRRALRTAHTLYRRVREMGPTQRAYATLIAIERIVNLLPTMVRQGEREELELPSFVDFPPENFEQLANQVLATIRRWRALVDSQGPPPPERPEERGGHGARAFLHATHAAGGFFDAQFRWDNLDSYVDSQLHPDGGLPQLMLRWLALRVAAAALNYAAFVLSNWGVSYKFHGEIPVGADVASAIWAAATAWGLHEAPVPGTDYARYRNVFLREWWRALENTLAFREGLTDPGVT